MTGTTALAGAGTAPAQTPEMTIGAEHAEPVPAALSALPGKRALFAVDSYFRDGWDDLVETVPDPWSLLDVHATVLLTPDAVAGRRLEAALEWLLEQDAVIAAAEPLRLDRHSTRALWWYQWNVATRERRALTDLLASAGESLLLVARLPRAPIPATLRISQRKGSADPSRRERWQLRHRLDGPPSQIGTLITFAHTADEPADLVREFGILLDGPDRRRVYADLAAGVDREAEARALIAELYERVPGHDLSVPAARDRAERGTPVDPWDGVVLGGAAMVASPEPDKAPLVTAVTTAQWEHLTAQPTRPLRFDRTLPYRLVHKAGPASVLLTDQLAAPGGAVLLAGELPTAHRFLNDLPRTGVGLDLAPILELTRQSCYVLAHAHHGAPDDARFALRGLRAALVPGASAHRRVRIEATVAEARRDGLDLTLRFFGMDGLGMDGDGDGVPLANAASSFTWMGEESWRAERAAGRARHGLGPEVGPPDMTGTFPAARAVGRSHDDNVILADPVWRPGTMTARVVMDPANPGLFDKPQDHITAVALMEAARQAALWATSRHLALPAGQLAVTALDSTHPGIGELDAALSCTARIVADRGGKASVAVSFAQDGVEVCAASAEVVRT
ncbi:AfsA-related hotdog domain-containing protein [Actinocorallia sp. A-T 12471]|uniref:AfsA-related hotdog domain-containing protein n=1 Tax=Actinocorallia sp. A-T 12471 TaxID=3089813 RepID=UPI0029D2D95F|nr:AfsA-related hotdog domain-containing protein [Actinocorallia sp. A-T 12471]MDX6739312.1 AfsA-related hotdog domain-containing protein [Actinocorallia sp. A-T 12471]